MNQHAFPDPTEVLQPFDLQIWYLEDKQEEFNKIENLKGKISELIQEKLRIYYASVSCCSVPQCNVSVEWFPSTDELRKGIECVTNHTCTRSLIFPSLLLLDVYLRDSDGKSIAITEVMMDGKQRFLDWLQKILPSVPHRFLTQASFQDVRLKWHLSKDVSADDLAVILMHRHPEFWERLQSYTRENIESWHTPGHNRGTAFKSSVVLRPLYEAYTHYDLRPMVFATDLSVSVEQLGDLSEPDNSKRPMADAMRKAAEVFGAHQTLFCTNGSSTSNRVILMTLLRPGETVLIDRNCHKSVHQAVVMSGALPYYLTPKFDAQLGLWRPLSLLEIEAGIREAEGHGLSPKLLILTTCTYDGVLFPIKEIADLAHRHEILVCADEAWFAYGRFHPHYGNGPSEGRYSALDSDADFCVHSSHKVLAAFSQASMIHIGRHFWQLLEQEKKGAHFAWLRDRFESYAIFRHQFEEILRFWLSTSPHYPMVATLDAATAQMGIEGPRILDKLLKEAAVLHSWAQTQGYDINRNDLIGDHAGYELYAYDPLKFSVRIKHGRRDEFLQCLEDGRHQWEKATERTAMFLLTVGTYHEQVQNLLQTLDGCKELLGSDREEPLPEPYIRGQVVVLPQDAHYAKGRYLSLNQVKNLAQNSKQPVACHMVTPFPPGIPTILPGLRISPSAIEWIEHQRALRQEIHGLLTTDGSARIRILEDSEYDALLKRYENSPLGQALGKLQAIE